MMFYVFGAAVVLATFAAVNAAASIVLMVVAPAAKGALDRTSASTRTRALLALRLAPSAAAAAVATFLVLPAYMLFEPAQAGERVTLPLALLAAGALALALHGLVRGIRALRATSAIEQRWKARSEPMADGQSSVPVFRVRDSFPVFTVVGLRRPSLYVSDRVLEALAPSEIAAAMAHERSHLDTRDNVKRLLLRTCPDLVAFFPLSRTIEQEWAQAAEMLADERASRGCRETALALAAGLVKVARLVPAEAGGLPVSALHDGGDVDARVRHLIADPHSPADGPRRGKAFALLAGAMAGTLALTLATQAWPVVHELIEVAARLLR